MAKRAAIPPKGARKVNAEGASGTTRTQWAVRGAVVLAILVGLLFLGREAGERVTGLLASLEGLGAWAPLAFILVYALATVAFIPGSILTLAGGALFGILEGTAYVLVGALLGSGAAFLIARYVARSWVERRVADDERFEAVDRAVAEDGRKIVFLLRLSPLFPYNLLNYALGLTRVRFTDYLIASLGMLPGIVLYVYSGRLVGDVAMLAAGADVERGAGYYAVLGLGLLATVVVTVLVTRRARRALKEATG
jgi:uncharacterized membrane protein YdjX (TVP38/TMEM64 family)